MANYRDELKVGDWRIDYIGRAVNENFWDIFAKGKKPDRTVTGEIGYAYCLGENSSSDNVYDYEEDRYTLNVYVAKDAAETFRIVGIVPLHHNTWSTSSDWADKHYRKSSTDICLRQLDRVRCLELMDRCSVDDLDKLVFDLVRYTVAHDSAAQLQRVTSGWCVECENGVQHRIFDKAKAFRLAYSFPEILLFPEYAKSVFPYTIDPYFISHINFDEFFYGFDRSMLLKALEKRVLLVVECVSEITQWSPKSAEAMVRARVEEKHVAISRIREGYCAYDVIECRMVEYSPEYKIPVGSMCYFSAKNKLIGFVTPDFHLYRLGVGNLDAAVDEKNVVTDPSGRKIGLLMKFGFAVQSRSRSRLQYKLWHTELGAIFDEGRYMGYACNVVGHEWHNAILKPYCVWESDGVDRRWMGLPFFFSNDEGIRFVTCPVKDRVYMPPQFGDDETPIGDVDDDMF